LDKDKEIENLKKALERQKLARKEAESFINSKSLELYESNAKLLKLNETLEDEVRKRTKKIEEKEKQFKDLIENATDIIFTINVYGFFTYVNPVAEKVSGYSKVELLKMSFVNLIRDDYKNSVTKHYFNQLNQKEELTYIEFPIINKQEELLWISQKARLILDENGPKEFIVIARDVTDIKAVNELVQQSEEKYRGIIENLKLGILEVDNDDKIIKSYPQFCVLSGYKEEELIGKSPSELFLDESSREIMTAQNKQRLVGNSGVYEIPILKKNGDIAWVIISGAPFYNSKGVKEGTVGVHLDITERKNMESELRDANLKSEELNKVKEMFMANMSHEIRTPMNAIIGMAELLKESVLTTSQQSYISAIASSSTNLLLLINDLLDFSKIESGYLTLEFVTFNLPKLIAKNKALVSLKADENGVNIVSDIDKNLPTNLLGDPIRLGQVILNLLSNAVKFTNNGTVTIKVELIEKQQNRNTLKFSVKDDGIGIEPNEFENIFEDFSQAKSTTTRLFGGTGLGLPISKKIVNLMDGKLKVKSKLNEGSDFYFTIVLEESELVEDQSAHSTQLTEDFKQKKVLVVEDNPVNILMAKTILEKWNCNVFLAKNGIEAIEKVQQAVYDVILMDMRMPKMGGLEATQLIRNEFKISTPIIALTANAIKGENDKCLAAGMNDYVSKPYKQIELNKTLTKWMFKEDFKEIRLYNLTKLEEMNDAVFLNKMVKLFSVETDKEIELMQKALDHLDFKTVSDKAHKIKPSISYICISRLFEEAKMIEKWEGTEAEMINKTTVFIKDMRLVLEQLKQI
jgi:PAS domain S-box-containing protein